MPPSAETWPTLGLVQAADDPEQSQVVGKWALDLIPHEETGVTLLSAWDVAIPANSEHKDLAWEWIKMYTSAEKQQEFYDDFDIFSPRKDFWEQDAIKDAGLYPLREALDTANMWWRIAASVEADTAINTIVSAYLTDQIDLEEARDAIGRCPHHRPGERPAGGGHQELQHVSHLYGPTKE